MKTTFVMILNKFNLLGTENSNEGFTLSIISLLFTCFNEPGMLYNYIAMTHSQDDIQSVPLATEPGISLIILPLMRILQRNLTHTSDTHYRHALDTFLFISHTTKLPMFKFLHNIFIGVRIIKEMPVSVASGTPCIYSCFYAFLTLHM